MLRTCLLLCALLTALAPPVRAQEGGNGTLLTLDEAVRQAYAHNHALRIARNRAEIASNDHALGNAGVLPALSLTAQQSRRAAGGFGGTETFGSASALDMGVSVSTTLFDGFGRMTAYERLGSAARASALAAERFAAETMADVVFAYYDLVRQQEQVEVLREAVVLSEERRRIATLRRDLGSASELDVRRAQVDLNADRAALLRQEISLTNARARFNQLLARPARLDFRVADTIQVDRTLDLEALRTHALVHNPTLRHVRQEQETALLTVKEVRAERLPSLNLQAGYVLSDFTQELGLAATRPGGFSYGLSASWDLFDGFNRRRRLANAGLQVRNTQLALEEVQVNVETLLENAYHSYRSSLMLVDLERENVALAALNVEVALERFRQGTITSVELREVQSALTAAEGRFITAQYEAKRAETELLELSGTLSGRLGLAP